MAHKIAVVGDKDSIMPFKLLGFSVFFCRDGAQARQQIDTLVKDNYGIIYVTEQLAQSIPETISRYDQMVVPSIILIPSHKGTLSIGTKRIQENVEKAIGRNIL